MAVESLPLTTRKQIQIVLGQVFKPLEQLEIGKLELCFRTAKEYLGKQK